MIRIAHRTGGPPRYATGELTFTRPDSFPFCVGVCSDHPLSITSIGAPNNPRCAACLELLDDWDVVTSTAA